MIAGYRKLTEEEQEAVNSLKQLEECCLQAIELLHGIPGTDFRWSAVGTTHIQQGFMALVRSITRPERVKLNTDA